MRLLCTVFKHSPDRKRVWFDDQDFRAPCARCGIPLVKDTVDGWRPFDSSKDAPPGAPPRAPRPSGRATRP